MSNKQEQSKIKYFIYVRKSSESEDRQALSIESQIDELQKIAKEENLTVIDILQESKSAKKPGRPIFNDLMTRIHNGEAQGILCWKLDRLARNPIDGGTINWMVQQGTIKHIQTCGRSYYPTDNVLMMSVEFGMANQFIMDLSAGVKRGLEKKARMGWLPGVAPLGYLNTPDLEKGFKIIVKDTERFNVIRKMWELMLTGSYTPPKILDIANNEWGFKTRRFKRIGGNPLSRSGIYKIFTSQFYAGIVEHNGIEYQGKHEPMITLDEYDRVQMLLGRKGKPRPKRHSFAFTGAIRCGECGCLYTAETKKKLLKSGEVKEHTYYHCTRKTRKVQCSQKKNIPADNLELAIEKEIEKYTILPQFLDWALEGLESNNSSETENKAKIRAMQEKALSSKQEELSELTKMRARNLIDDESFISERKEIQSEIIKINESLQNTGSDSDQLIELTKKTFSFAAYAHKEFLTASGPRRLERKKEILLSLGENPIIRDGELIIEPYEWLVPIKNEYPALEAEYLRLEPTKVPMNKTKTEALASVRARWLGVLDEVRTLLLQGKSSFSYSFAV